MTPDDLEKLKRIHENYKKWNDNIENFYKPNFKHNYNLQSISINYSGGKISLDIGDMDPVVKRILVEKIREAVRERYEEVKARFDGITIRG